jgi:hypothetical protein
MGTHSLCPTQHPHRVLFLCCTITEAIYIGSYDEKGMTLMFIVPRKNREKLRHLRIKYCVFINTSAMDL